MIPQVVILVGPTASGKSSLAVELAKHFPLEIVSADSLQIFRHLNIGSAKPTEEELSSTPHHLIDVLDPDEEATSAWYAEEALSSIQEITRRKMIPLVVGGAGFYLRALEHPPKAEPTSFESEVTDEDYDYLLAHDPEAAKKIHRNDHYRIGRAISLIKSGELPSQKWKNAEEETSPIATHWFGLEWDRAKLYGRIDQRMEQMFALGLLDETEHIAKRFPKAIPRLARSIGYCQALSILKGEVTPNAAMEEAKMRSRQYAKRQLTWFRRESRIAWFSGKNALSDVVQEMERLYPR